MDDQGDPDDFDVLTPSEILQAMFEYAQQVALFREIPAGYQLIRARWEAGDRHYQTPEELGPPPRAVANQANRMSPAGIPMFYGCDDEETALLETASGPGYYALGVFETMRPVVLLDLTDIPEVPGLFEPVPDFQEVDPRRALRFLHHIAAEMSRPVERDDRVYIEYVPTQVVTEFIRCRVARDGANVDGIGYASSVNEGYVSYVLFADQSNLVRPSAVGMCEDRWLRLVDSRRRWLDPSEDGGRKMFARFTFLLRRFVNRFFGAKD